MTSKASKNPNKAGLSASPANPVSSTSEKQTPAKHGGRFNIMSGVFYISILVAITAILANFTMSQVKDWLMRQTKCEDLHENCAFWAENNECNLNPEYMSRICVKSCKLCSTGQQQTNVAAVQESKESAKEEPPTKVTTITDDADVDVDGFHDYDKDEDYADDDNDDEENDDDDDYNDNDENEAYDEEYVQTGTPRILSDDDEEAAERNEDDNNSCVDSDPDCPGWAESGECEANPGWMLVNCRKSCNTCALESDDCRDEDPDCAEFAHRGECEANPNWMQAHCKRSCGACDTNESDEGEEEDEEAVVVENTCTDDHKRCESWAAEGECENNPDYMLEHCKRSCNVCSSEEVACRDRQPRRDCEARRDEGECERNPGWMIVMCGKTCNKCDLLPQKRRCLPEVFQDPDYVYEDALKEKGDLTRMFERIIREYPKTEVVLQPPEGPWIVQLPDFITPLERETLLNLTLPHVKRSTDQGAFNAEGIQEQIVSEGRTSSNAWCMDECADSQVVQGLTNRVAQLLTVPLKNFESYQVLQYKINQKYDVHHDSSNEDLDDMAGPRILTFFIYLSDVEEGGETWFNKLDLKIKPKTGMALIWPSVLDDDPSQIDWRTTHAALPVKKGLKLAANLWIHMRDFTTPNLWGCTGAFD